MGTTKFEIQQWFNEGVKRGATHMLVVCDSFDHEDYPKYVMPGEDPHLVSRQLGEMQRLMEVYNLRMDRDSQLNEQRSFHWETIEKQPEPQKVDKPKTKKIKKEDKNMKLKSKLEKFKADFSELKKDALSFKDKAEKTKEEVFSKLDNIIEVVSEGLDWLKSEVDGLKANMKKEKEKDNECPQPD